MSEVSEPVDGEEEEARWDDGLDAETREFVQLKTDEIHVKLMTGRGSRMSRTHSSVRWRGSLVCEIVSVVNSSNGDVASLVQLRRDFGLPFSRNMLNEYTFYHHVNMPSHMVIEYQGTLYLIPDIPGGWKQRTLYHGQKQSPIAGPFETNQEAKVS